MQIEIPNDLDSNLNKFNNFQRLIISVPSLGNVRQPTNFLMRHFVDFNVHVFLDHSLLSGLTKKSF